MTLKTTTTASIGDDGVMRLFGQADVHGFGRHLGCVGHGASEERCGKGRQRSEKSHTQGVSNSKLLIQAAQAKGQRKQSRFSLAKGFRQAEAVGRVQMLACSLPGHVK